MTETASITPGAAPAAAPAAAPPGVSHRRLTLVSVVLLLGAITTILDTTIVNVALDRLHLVFHASVSSTQWIASGYLLALAGVIPLTGWATERFGARRVWMVAVATFGIGSVLCGLSWSLPSLIAFRLLQGVGGGMVLPVTITILTRAAGPDRLSRAIGAIGIPAQLAPILGPVIGASLIASVSWRWLFFVNVPLCLAALLLAPRLLPVDSRKPGHPFDLIGFVLLTPGLVGLAFGISQASGDGGFGRYGAWGPATGGALLVIGFVVYSLRLRTRQPLVDVRPFARRGFGLASAITVVGGFSTYAAMFLLPLFYQQLRGASTFDTGLLLVPQGLGTILFLLLNRLIAGRIETRWLVTAGGALQMLGMVPFVVAGASGGDLLLLGGQFLFGLGGGAVLMTIMTAAFADLSHDEIPRAGAAFSIVQRVGAPFGVTVIAVLLEGALSRAGSGSQAVASAFGATFAEVLAFGVVPLVLGMLLPRVRRRH